jgi:hypothetical protein
MCDECFEYGCILKRENCIICLESKHATKFKIIAEATYFVTIHVEPRYLNVIHASTLSYV